MIFLKEASLLKVWLLVKFPKCAPFFDVKFHWDISYWALNVSFPEGGLVLVVFICLDIWNENVL